MTTTLEDLIAQARKVPMTDADKERQRRSFAFGNTAIENPLVTREMVDEVADALSKAADDGDVETRPALP